MRRKRYKKVRRVEKRKKGNKLLIVIGSIVLAALVCVVFMESGSILEKLGLDKKGQTKIGTTSELVETKEMGVGYAISSSSKDATQAGEKILEAGGNAVDAAVAVSYTLAVAEPQASGLGGGGCMVVYDPESDKYIYYGYGAEMAQSGGSSNILIPGFVDGMDSVLADYGTMDYAAILQPAIDCCDGVTVTGELDTKISRHTDALGEDSVFCVDGEWLEEGDTLVQPELKKTLQTLVAEGPAAFYEGEIGRKICEVSGFSVSDLAAYETVVEEAVVGEYNGYEIATVGMPYSGVTLIQMLKMSELLEIPDPDEDNQEFLDILQQITVLSHRNRMQNVYDTYADNVKTDIQDYVSDEYVENLLSQNITDFEYDEESEDTTAFTIIDKEGMIVSCTNTLSSFFGSKKSAAGVYMNNTGVNWGSGVNAPEAGKRPRSHIAPTILRSDDEVIAIASPGGNVIVKVLGAVLMDICEFGTPAQEAIDKQRLFFKTGDMITYEMGYDTELIAQVERTGYAAVSNSSHSYFGNIALVGTDKENGYYSTTDIRRNGYGISSN